MAGMKAVSRALGIAMLALLGCGDDDSRSDISGVAIELSKPSQCPFEAVECTRIRALNLNQSAGFEFPSLAGEVVTTVGILEDGRPAIERLEITWEGDEASRSSIVVGLETARPETVIAADLSVRTRRDGNGVLLIVLDREDTYIAPKLIPAEPESPIHIVICLDREGRFRCSGAPLLWFPRAGWPQLAGDDRFECGGLGVPEELLDLELALARIFHAGGALFTHLQVGGAAFRGDGSLQRFTASALGISPSDPVFEEVRRFYLDGERAVEFLIAFAHSLCQGEARID